MGRDQAVHRYTAAQSARRTVQPAADTPASIQRELDLLEGQVGILELRRRIILAEADQGASVPDATRPLHPHEIKAQVQFATIDKLIEDAATAAAASAGLVWAFITTRLTEILHSPDVLAGSTTGLVTALRQLASPVTATTIGGLADRIQAVTSSITGVLKDAARAGALELVAEARRQGVPMPDVNTITLDAGLTARLQLAAAAVAEQPAARLLPAAYDLAYRSAPAAADAHALADTVTTGVNAIDQAGTLDAARQAAHGAHGVGRAAATTIPQDPIKAIYASELLDRNGCQACGEIDGTEYASMDEFLTDYPSGGGYRDCAGGLRCRGTGVFVWDTEADPTVQR